MTPADRKILRRAGPFWTSTYFHPDVHEVEGAWIVVAPCKGRWTCDYSRPLAKAIECLLNEAARPKRKKGRKQ